MGVGFRVGSRNLSKFHGPRLHISHWNLLNGNLAKQILNDRSMGLGFKV